MTFDLFFFAHQVHRHFADHNKSDTILNDTVCQKLWKMCRTNCGQLRGAKSSWQKLHWRTQQRNSRWINRFLVSVANWLAQCQSRNCLNLGKKQCRWLRVHAFIDLKRIIETCPRSHTTLYVCISTPRLYLHNSYLIFLSCDPSTTCLHAVWSALSFVHAHQGSASIHFGCKNFVGSQRTRSFWTDQHMTPWWCMCTNHVDIETTSWSRH